MTLYTYSITEDGDRVNVAIQEGTTVAASAIIMKGRLDFESYSVFPSHQGKGLSYALTYLMLLYCKDNQTPPPGVSNAHGVLMESLPKSGFPQEGAVRVTKGGKERAGSYKCANVQMSLELIKKIMIAKGIITDGLRFTGPYRWKMA